MDGDRSLDPDDRYVRQWTKRARRRRPDPQQTGDVTGTLAELERKLRELERELTLDRQAPRARWRDTAQEAAAGTPPCRRAGGWWTRRSSRRRRDSAAPIAPPSPDHAPSAAGTAATEPAGSRRSRLSQFVRPLPPAESGQPMKSCDRASPARPRPEPAADESQRAAVEPQGRRPRSARARARRSSRAWRSCGASATGWSALRGIWRPSTTRCWAG